MEAAEHAGGRFQGFPLTHVNNRRSVPVSLTKSWTESKHPLHPLHFLEHLLEYGSDWILGGLGQNAGCRSERLAGHGSITAECSIADSSTWFEILRHDPRDGYACAGIDHARDDQFGERVVTRKESQLYPIGLTSGDPAQGGPLQGAIPAPWSGEAQDLHVAREASEEFLLITGEFQLAMSLNPGGLLVEWKHSNE